MERLRVGVWSKSRRRFPGAGQSLATDNFLSFPQYADLIAANKFVGADGKTPVGNFQYFWDDTTASPFLYDKTSGLFVTYDNPDSIKAKTAWAKKAGLKGIKLFSVQGDTGDLIKAAKEGWAS